MSKNVCYNWDLNPGKVFNYLPLVALALSNKFITRG